MFLQVSVIHSVHGGGVSGEPPLGRENPTPPLAGRTPRTRENPPWQGEPPWQGNPPRPGRTPPSRENPPWQGNPPSRENPPGTRENPPREEDCSIRSMSGRYASYWNAFLFIFSNYPFQPQLHKYFNPPSPFWITANPVAWLFTVPEYVCWPLIYTFQNFYWKSGGETNGRFVPLDRIRIYIFNICYCFIICILLLLYILFKVCNKYIQQIFSKIIHCTS